MARLSGVVSGPIPIWTWTNTTKEARMPRIGVNPVMYELRFIDTVFGASLRERGYFLDRSCRDRENG